MSASALSLPPGYAAHSLHGADCAWPEKNCYVDVWIEVLHALRLEPAAMLAFTLTVDFEGDQWRFFKPPHEALWRLYGVEVFELNLWRGDLLGHALQQVRAGRLVFAEADAHWLPDTQGTDYRRQHTKSTIVINALDPAQRRLGYFHNTGYHTLQGEDFVRLFRLEPPRAAADLPLFAECVRLDRVQRRPAGELLQRSLDELRHQLQRVPADNPVRRFAAQLPGDVERLTSEGLDDYHGYAFAGPRQLGAAFELAAHYLDWLGAGGEPGLAAARAAFADLSGGAKTLLLKTARVVNARKQVDFGPSLAAMAAAWDAGFDALRQRYC